MNTLLKNLAILAVILLFGYIRAVYFAQYNYVSDIDLKTLGIIHSGFPFGIIKMTLFNDYFLPFYYFVIYFINLIFKSAVALRIFNSIIAFITVCITYKIGLRLCNWKLGVLIASMFAVNHFFLLHSLQIAPYCFTFLFGALVILALINFVEFQDKKSFQKLALADFLFLMCDKTAIIYILAQLLVLKRTRSKNKNIKKYFKPLVNLCFLGIVIVLPVAAFQAYVSHQVLIPDLAKKIAFNLNGLYLTLNEYVSPYLSFQVSEFQTNSTLGMVYNFFMNPDLKNLNAVKWFLTLFFSSILPLTLGFYLFNVAYKKDYRLKVVGRTAIYNFVFFVILAILRFSDLNPIYTTQFFITFIILFSYGIYLIKDKVIRVLVIFSLIAIQLISPKINSFNTALDKKYATVDVFETFLSEHKNTLNSVYLIPYMGKYVKHYLDSEINVLEFDYSLLFTRNNNKILSDPNKKLTKRNFFPLLQNYLKEASFSDNLGRYFSKNDVAAYKDATSVILFIDKLNSRPISVDSIEKCSEITDYKQQYNKIYFKNPAKNLSFNKLFLNSLKSKTLYSIIELLKQNYFTYTIIQYKKMGNNYLKVPNNTNNIYKEINSYSSDYVFVIFGKLPIEN